MDIFGGAIGVARLIVEYKLAKSDSLKNEEEEVSLGFLNGFKSKLMDSVVKFE